MKNLILILPLALIFACGDKDGDTADSVDILDSGTEETESNSEE